MPTPEAVGIPTSVTNFTWSAFFGLLAVIINGTAFGVWLKTRPVTRKIDVDADEKLRSEMWKDIEALKLSKEDTSRRLTLAEARVAGQTVQIGQQRFVLMLVIDELERVSPGNSVARQARVMLREVQPAAMPQAEDLAALSRAVANIDPPPPRSDP